MTLKKEKDEVTETNLPRRPSRGSVAFWVVIFLLVVVILIGVFRFDRSVSGQTHTSDDPTTTESSGGGTVQDEAAQLGPPIEQIISYEETLYTEELDDDTLTVHAYGPASEQIITAEDIGENVWSVSTRLRIETIRNGNRVNGPSLVNQVHHSFWLQASDGSWTALPEDE